MHLEQFDDFDAFSESVRDLDCTMMLQNPASRSWTIRAAEVAGLRVQMGQLGSGNIVEGLSWVDGSMIYLPLSETCLYSANGREIRRSSFMTLDPGTEFALSTQLEHDWCSISVPSHVLDRDPEFEEPSRASRELGCRITRANPRLARQFQETVWSVLATVSKNPQFETSLGATVASASLLELGTRILGRSQAPEIDHVGRHKIPRQEIIRRSKALLEAREGAYVSIPDLVSSTGVSTRTLRAAFKETFGVGPARYLQLRNLHRIRRALQAAAPEETTVAEVLSSHGEWQFGRCAARYHRLFGELPSETLRAARHAT